jgi:CRP-like cAMP-binding protein
MPRELINVLARDFGEAAELAEAEWFSLNGIQPRRLCFEKDAVVFREGEPANSFLLVKEGVCFNHRHLEDGSRQIIDLYFPGEVVAPGELSRECHVSGLTTFSRVEFLAYDKDEIKDGFSQSPRLSRLFIELISQEQAHLTDRLVGVSRYCAKQRVANFLLEVRSRAGRAIDVVSGSDVTTVTLALPWARVAGGGDMVGVPQVLIADALGLSIVHVNRVLRGFKEAGYIRTHSQGIELLDIEGLKKAAG